MDSIESFGNIIDLTPENAQSVLYEASERKLVLLYFWSDTCSHCASMGPLLEKIAKEYDESLLLAKVNCDEQAELSGQFGVRSLPTVMLVKSAQSVGGFSGGKTELELREALDEHLPKPWEISFSKGSTFLSEDDYAAAVPLLKAAFEESGQRADIACAYTLALTGLKRLDDAQLVLDTVKPVYQDADFAKASAQLKLAQEAGKSPALEALEQQYKSEPENEALALQLAIQYSQNQYTKEALDTLYTLLQKSISCLDGDARKAYTDILNSLEKGDALASDYQRKLYTLLY